jgi:hypothetical protein
LTVGLRIGLRLWDVGTMDLQRAGNVQGDEQVARGWQKYLLRQDDVESVHLFPREATIESELDVLIHFTPFGRIHDGVKNLLYLQNAFPPESYPGGTIGVFNQVKAKYDGYLFTSQKLMQACAPGVVVPFATDPEVFFPQDCEGYRHQVAFVGNDIRGPIANHRFFLPALPFGLVIYGNQAWQPPFAQLCRGKLPMADLPKLYSSALINLNVHIPEHVAWDTLNLRVYDALACGGFVLSDRTPTLESDFEEFVVCTDGDEDEWAKLARYVSDPGERRRRGSSGREYVLHEHTYAARARTVLNFLHEVV